MPLFDTFRIRGNQFRPIGRFVFWTFVVNLFILMFIGSQHVEIPYVNIWAACTRFYFRWFILILPIVGVIENSLMDLATTNSKRATNNIPTLLMLINTNTITHFFFIYC